MSFRRSLATLVACALALSSVACSSLTKPDEITIKAEPPPAPPAPPAPAAPAAPAPGNGAAPPGSGG